MSSSERNAKIYGAVETETFITFEGFCKKIYHTEQQKVEVFIDNEKIDTILANQKISNIEDTYEVFDTEGFCFTYKLPQKYIGKKHKLEFKNIDGEQLIHSPFSTIDVTNEKYNEYCFLESLKEPIDEEKIKDLYCPNCIGFLATGENLEDMEFVEYIKKLMVRFPDVQFKGFCFTVYQSKQLEQLFKNLTIITPTSFINVLEHIELFIFHKNDYKTYLPFIINVGSRNDLTHRVYFVNEWYSSELKFCDFNDGKDPYDFNDPTYNYSKEDFENSKGNNANLYFSKLLKIANKQNIYIDKNDYISKWQYFERISLLLNSHDVKLFLNKSFKGYIK